LRRLSKSKLIFVKLEAARSREFSNASGGAADYVETKAEADGCGKIVRLPSQ
jgi:hypothetical protein